MSNSYSRISLPEYFLLKKCQCPDNEKYTGHIKKETGLSLRAGLSYLFKSLSDYPPKLSYMIEDSSTPRLSSIATTAFDIGPGPHM